MTRVAVVALVTVALGITVTATSLVAGCTTSDKERSAPKGNAAAAVAPEPVEVSLSGPHLRFTYLGKDGKFAMAQRASDVPKEGRGAVMVVDLHQRQSDTDAVWVVDLRAEPPVERVLARAMPRPDFERLAQGQQVADRPAVIMYATSWCGVCKSARRFLKQHKVAYKEHDIEKDARAATQLRESAQRAGVEARGVPVFDVGGQLLTGFDESALRKLLRL